MRTLLPLLLLFQSTFAFADMVGSSHPYRKLFCGDDSAAISDQIDTETQRVQKEYDALGSYVVYVAEISTPSLSSTGYFCVSMLLGVR